MDAIVAQYVVQPPVASGEPSAAPVAAAAPVLQAASPALTAVLQAADAGPKAPVQPPVASGEPSAAPVAAAAPVPQAASPAQSAASASNEIAAPVAPDASGTNTTLEPCNQTFVT